MLVRVLHEKKKGRRTYLECISSHVFYKRARALYVSFNDLHRFMKLLNSIHLLQLYSIYVNFSGT